MYINIKAKIRIGTRESALAVWQAKQVQGFFTLQGISSEIIFIKSDGDTDLVTPLYAMGVQGVFTKSLDAALLNNRIDVTVHSLKDVPIHAARGLQKAAVLERHNPKDILVCKSSDNGQQNFPSSIFHRPTSKIIIATGSIRRAAHWKNRFPDHSIENLRGNVNTRLRKLEESNWNGAIFAAAGLERLGIRPKNSIDLDWMLPAPAQGAVAVYCRENDFYILDACKIMNDKATEICTAVERDFLNALAGGCAAPISALANIEDGIITLKGNILSPDGSLKIETEKFDIVKNAGTLGQRCADDVLKNGAEILIKKHERYMAMVNDRVKHFCFSKFFQPKQAFHGVKLNSNAAFKKEKNLVLHEQ